MRQQKGSIILGAGGHAKVVASLIKLSRNYELLSLIDVNSEKCSEFYSGTPIFGRSTLDSLIDQRLNFFLALGSIFERKKWWDYLKGHGSDTPNLISPYAIIDETALLGDGNIVASRSFVGPNVSIGDNNLLNTGSILEHDCIVGNHNHVAPAATLCGRVLIKNQCWIGAGATVIQNISIEDNVVVGAGSIVTRDLMKSRSIYVGNPAKRLNK